MPIHDAVLCLNLDVYKWSWPWLSFLNPSLQVNLSPYFRTCSDFSFLKTLISNRLCEKLKMYSSEDITIFNTTELSPATTLSDSPPYLTQSGVTNWWNWGYDWTSPEQSSRTSISSTSGGYGSVENSFSQPGFVTSPQATSTPARTRSAYAESSSGSSSNWSYEQGQGTRTRLVQPRPPHEPTRYISISTQFVYSAPQRAPILARVSLTDYRGHLEFDTFISGC